MTKTLSVRNHATVVLYRYVPVVEQYFAWVRLYSRLQLIDHRTTLLATEARVERDCYQQVLIPYCSWYHTVDSLLELQLKSYILS